LNTYREFYEKEVKSALMRRFQYKNIMEVPKIVKITVNIGLGEALQNIKALDAASGDIKLITGQKPVITKAKKSIASFKLREGMSVGCMVTLRRERMYEFYHKLVTMSCQGERLQGGLPEVLRRQGQLHPGIERADYIPEIEYDKIDKIRGMNITITTTAKTDEEGHELLKLMGMPFRS
jgi:large subunit ribosomal protein L5